MGADFRAPKSGYRSQKRPAFFPDLFWRSLLGSCFCNSIDKSSINSFGVNKNKRDFDYVISFLRNQEYGGIFSSHIAGKTYLSNVSWHWLKIFDFCSLRVSEATSQRCSLEKVFWTPIPKCDFNKVALQLWVSHKSHFGMGALL